MPYIKVRDNEPIESAIRRFKRVVEKSCIHSEAKKREFYEKPTQERKRKKASAIKRLKKKVNRENNKFFYRKKYNFDY